MRILKLRLLVNSNIKFNKILSLYLLIDLSAAELDGLREFVFSRQESVFKNIDLNNRSKRKLRLTILDYDEKYAVVQRYSFAKIRFYGLWSSQRPSTTLGVNTK